MSNLHIRLLGQLEISQPNTSTQLRLSSACQKLLAYLLLNTGKMCRREVLMDVFWQNNSPERARSCLNSGLWRLRRELESNGFADANDLLTTDSLEVGFNWSFDYWLDTQSFEESLAPILRKPVSALEAEEAAQVERVLAFYRGELLEGIYDDWTLVERERLRSLYANALTYLMDYHASSNAFEKSLSFAKAILIDDPLREDIHRAIMRLYVSAGQRALAVQQYRACASILERELSIVPMEETQQLYQQIANASSVPQSSAVDMAFVQQNAEQHLLAVIRNLNQAHNHLKQAAHGLARLRRLNVDA